MFENTLHMTTVKVRVSYAILSLKPYHMYDLKQVRDKNLATL